MELKFSIEGSYITKLARDRFFLDNKPAEAIELLLGCLQSDDISEDERYIIALKILNGNMEIVGTYPEDDYGVEETKSKEPLLSLFKHFNEQNEKLESAKKEIKEWQEKFLFLADHIAEDGEWALREVNREYFSSTGEYLFDLGTNDTYKTVSDDALDSFIKRMTSESSDDYGWLEPDGTFHPVEWGDHEKWASDWLKENKPFSENADLYWLTESGGQRQHITGGDVLVFKLHWVLLHNPFQGIAEVKCDPVRRLTDAQKEFLYDYYIERNEHKKANAIYE